MACQVTHLLTQVMDSDRHTIKTYYAIYAVVFAGAVIVSVLFLRYHWAQNDLLSKLAGAAISALAIPLIPFHIRRLEALRMENLLLRECGRYAPADPECKRIEDHVNAIIRVRTGVPN